MRKTRSLLLWGAAARLGLAVPAVLGLWLSVLWAWPDRPALTMPASLLSGVPSVSVPVANAPGEARVAASGQRTPIGGTFDRFDVAAQPIVAPVNASGKVAFYASILRNTATEGIFLAGGGRVVRVAAVGDAAPGGGVLSGFARHPVPSLNDAGTIAFGATISSARAGEGIFLSQDGTLRIVALAGADAPGVIGGTFADFDAPAINNAGDVAFVATVRHGRETFQALYLLSNGRWRKLAAEGDPFLGGGVFGGFGLPSINNRGVVAFPATLEHGPTPGGIFVTGTRDLKLLTGVGALIPDGRMMVRLSERLALDDDDDIAFVAHLGSGRDAVEAVMKLNTSGLVLIAASGTPAPGGGKYAGFGPWPSTGPAGRIAFVAAIEDGPGPLGLYTWRAGASRRIVSAGETLADGRVLPPFAINAVTSAGADGSVTFATMGDGDAAIYRLIPESD